MAVEHSARGLDSMGYRELEEIYIKQKIPFVLWNDFLQIHAEKLMSTIFVYMIR